jgi:hypothetical protein
MKMPAIDLEATVQMTPAAASVVTVSTDVVSPLHFPLDLKFAGLLNRRLYFRNPIQVRLYKSEEESYVAECSELDQFGYGSNVAEALDDLGQTLSEMYFYLSDAKRAGTLGESLSIKNDVLSCFIGSREGGAPQAA